MSDIIRVEGLGKKYRVQKGVRGKRGSTLPPGLFSRGPKLTTEDFWALRDVSFSIRAGERIGIVGRNGAGKTTLLKLLSRITEPTAGKITLHGRIASLLAVGTGFHAELTGRENIFLNGAILGMQRSEILRKFDEIVDFAGVEQFLDVPVKRYSSGMYVRLGFAVAAHLEPDILVVDEVLAVGDVEFQKKCLGKMESVSASEGRTVLFVSHNMNMMTALCQRGLLIEGGQCVLQGDIAEAVLQYRGLFGQHTALDFTKAGAMGDEVVQLLSVTLTAENGENRLAFNRDEAIHVTLEYEILANIDATVVPRIDLIAPDGDYVFISPMPGLEGSNPGRFRAQCIIPEDLLNAGEFSLDVLLQSYGRVGKRNHLVARGLLNFAVTESILESDDRYGFRGSMPGWVRPRCKWTQVQL